MEETPHAEVDNVERLYEAGDYKRARPLAAELLRNEALEAGERERLEQVLRASKTDSVVVMALVFTFCMLAFLVIKYAL